ncbi:MATE family efflux transporter [Alienimonas californiensis]|uniref:Multidrug export protein MepA n=1 Tax=Alienimonas californiensis TaxID=2527989 RepID=A0A517PD83_9PLAN|nr:MATE family efflux transporter [Alienimonas californiensis]QDT17338.1 Multidrug export protein MepA [Alienimonas californiensis]
MPRPTRDEILSGPIVPVLARLAGPMLVGIVAVLTFSLVDAYFIGQLGEEELAAVAFTFPLTFLVTGAAMGLSVGTSTAVARAVGRDDGGACRLGTHSLGLALLVVAGMVVAGFALLDPALRAMGAREDLRELATPYMQVWLSGILLLVVPLVGNGALRGVGDTVSPTVVMLIAGAINAVLDPCLIFGLGPFPRLELPGAALATVASWSVTLFASLYLLRRRGLLSWAAAIGGGWRESWAEVLIIGLPAIGTNLLVPLSGAILTRLAAGFGTAAVAAFGVGGRVEALALVGVMAVGAVNSVFVGQNWGAGQCDRVRTAATLVLRFALLYGLAAWGVLFLLRRPLAAAFVNEGPDAADALVEAAQYFAIVPAGYAGFATTALVSGVYNALKRPSRSVLVISVRLFFLTVPLAWLGAQLHGWVGFLWGIVAGNLLAGLFAAWVVRGAFASEREEAGEPASAPNPPAAEDPAAVCL